MSRLIQSENLEVSESLSPLSFETTGGGSWPVWNRFLTLNGKHAYEIGNICSTCAFFFERLGGANKKIEVEALVESLRVGLPSLGAEVIRDLANMVPIGKYSVSLLQLAPKSVTLGSPGDYFVSEQQTVWGLDGFWGLPHSPKVPYYRSGDRAISNSERLFEFVIPMFPRNWLDSDGVEKYRSAMASGCKPTAVTLSVLDVKGAAVSEQDENVHWCFAHYLLDGHHKTEAASLEGGDISVLSFLALDHGVSDDDQLGKLNTLLDFI